MDNTKIKVIKRDQIATEERGEALMVAPVSEGQQSRDISDVVNNWITEQRSNRKVEEAFSHGKIEAWRML